MRFLLDTHCWLWSVSSPHRLSEATLALIQNTHNMVYFSVASAWEITIKYSIGKLPLPAPPEIFIPTSLTEQRIKSLPITNSHVTLVHTLPPHHQDPFDRLIIAQAIKENLSIISNDALLHRYDVPIIAA
jgi:PIN domain nuclease of toxin-antitoxin system